MSTRVQEKKYGGLTLAEIATMHDVHFRPEVVRDLVAEIKASGSDEMLSRMRRMETKIHKVAIATGAESRGTTMTLSAERVSERMAVHVPGYDVTLAQIKHTVEAADAPKGEKLYLLQGDTLLGILQLTPQA